MHDIPATSLLLLLLITSSGHGQTLDENEARQWLSEYNVRARRTLSVLTMAQFNTTTNLTAYNYNRELAAFQEREEFSKESFDTSRRFDWENFKDADLRRQFSRIPLVDTSHLDREDRTKWANLLRAMGQTYASATVSNRPGDETGRRYPLNPDLSRIFSSSRDWEELEWGWVGFRNATRDIRGNFSQSVVLQNLAARGDGFADAGETWRVRAFETRNLEDVLEGLWEQIRPLYELLHGHVLRRLKVAYPLRDFPSTGHIPAHILGDILGRNWANLAREVFPYPGISLPISTQKLDLGNYSPEDLYRLTQSFFTSMGFEKLPASFWDKSLFERPRDRRVSCQSRAWDFYDGENFRVTQCGEPTTTYLQISHYLTSIVYYFIAYKDQPVLFRQAPGEAFYPAIAGVSLLSLLTPSHLTSLGLLDDGDFGEEADLNNLMANALTRLVFLPYGYLLDLWRWRVFRGEITPDRYNTEWWQVRCRYQGVSPPVPRTEEDFDPAANSDVFRHSRNVHLFVSSVMQYQIYSSLCKTAGHTGPLYKCSLYNSRAAGDKLRGMMALGASAAVEDILETVTGSRELDAGPLLQYFQPLREWLEQQNVTTGGVGRPCPSSLVGQSDQGRADSTAGTHRPTVAPLAVGVLVTLYHTRVGGQMGI